MNFEDSKVSRVGLSFSSISKNNKEENIKANCMFMSFLSKLCGFYTGVIVTFV